MRRSIDAHASRTRARVALAVVAVITVVALAACGGTPASAAPATPLPSGVIAIEARDYAFTPADVTAPGGAVTFSVKNVSGQEHQFEIYSGETRVDGIDSLGAGATKDLTVTLQPGAYILICKLNGHDQLNMKGTLTVN